MTYVRYPAWVFPTPPDHVEFYAAPDRCPAGYTTKGDAKWICTLPRHHGTHEAACYLGQRDSYVAATWEDDDPGAYRE